MILRNINLLNIVGLIDETGVACRQLRLLSSGVAEYCRQAAVFRVNNS